MSKSLFSVLTIPVLKDWTGNVVLYLHGQLAEAIAERAHWPFLTFVSKQTGYMVIAPEYSVTSLVAHADVFSEVKRLYQVLATKVGARRVVVVGHGAGAGLALALAQHLRQEAYALPRHLILLAPWLDFYLPIPVDNPPAEAGYSIGQNGKLMRSAGGGQTTTNSQMLSPLKGKLSGLPLTSLFTSTREESDALKFKQLMHQQLLPLSLFTHDSLPQTWLQVSATESDGVRHRLIRAIIKGK